MNFWIEAAFPPNVWYLSVFMSFTSQKIIILRDHKNMLNVLNKYMVFPRLQYICVGEGMLCLNTACKT